MFGQTLANSLNHGLRPSVAAVVEGDRQNLLEKAGRGALLWVRAVLHDLRALVVGGVLFAGEFAGR